MRLSLDVVRENRYSIPMEEIGIYMWRLPLWGVTSPIIGRWRHRALRGEKNETFTKIHRIRHLLFTASRNFPRPSELRLSPRHRPKAQTKSKQTYKTYIRDCCRVIAVWQNDSYWFFANCVAVIAREKIDLRKKGISLNPPGKNDSVAGQKSLINRSRFFPRDSEAHYDSKNVNMNPIPLERWIFSAIIYSTMVFHWYTMWKNWNIECIFDWDNFYVIMRR